MHIDAYDGCSCYRKPPICATTAQSNSMPMGLEADVHAHLRQGIEDQADRLERVR
jgi:hypothetical protein